MKTPQESEITIGWRNSVSSIIGTGKFLDEKRKNLSTPEFYSFIKTELGLDKSAAGKLIKIASHPILSDPQYHSMLPPEWAKLYELLFLSDDVLLKIIKNGSATSIKKSTIWNLRGPKRRKYNRGSDEGLHLGKKASRIAHIKVPGGGSLLKLCREGLRLQEQENLSIEVVAARLGLGQHSYRMINAVLLLEGRTDLNEADKKTVQAALYNIETTHNVARYYRDVLPIIEKIWGTKPNRALNSKQEKRRKDTFSHAIALIYNTCMRSLEIEIPLLSERETKEAADQLSSAASKLSQLRGKIRRTR